MRPRIASLLIVLLVSTASADEPYKPPEFLAATPPLPAGLEGQNVLRIDLAESLRLAVKHNLDVVLERHAVEVARQGIYVARGELEPSVTAGYSHGNFQRPPLSLQEGAPDAVITATDHSWRLGIQQRFATGTRVDVQFDNSRARSSGGTAVQPINFGATLSATLTHPLLRGFSTDLVIPQATILRARIASDRARQQLVASITNVVERTEAAYWNVLLALYRYDLALRSYKQAEDQMSLTKRQIDAGTVPPSDLLSAESTHAQRKLDLVQAEQAIDQVSDALRAAMNLPRDQWKRPLLPTDVPRFTPSVATADAALELAIKHRPELVQLDLDVKAALLSVREAENNKLPQIDLGLSGTLFGQSDNYGGALSQMSSTDTRGWGVFLNLTWTPLTRATGAQAEIAKVQKSVTEVRREQTLQTVWLEVRSAVRDQLGAERRVHAAAKFRELAEKSLDIEQRKFLSGTSQNLFVAQRQEALQVARIAEVDALLAHVRATTALHRATGRLLMERQIEIGPEGAGRR
jgi:outer membrane protein